MNKKSIIIAGSLITGCAVSGFVGMAFGTHYAATKIMTRSGLPMTNAQDAINIIRKYELLGYVITGASEEQNTSPETMIQFFTLVMDIVKENPELMNDPRFAKVYVNKEFDGITKNLKMEEGDDG